MAQALVILINREATPLLFPVLHLNLLSPRGETEKRRKKTVNSFGDATKEPTMPDIDWHGRLFAIVGMIFYPRTSASHT